MKAEIDRLIRDYCIRLDDDSRTLSWSTTDQSASRRIRAMKVQIVARLRELGDQAVAANAAHVREKALERIVQFQPPSMAERTLASRRRPAEDRLEEASVLLTQWRAHFYSPQVELNPARVWCPVTEVRLPCPSYLLPEMFLLLHKAERVRLAADPLGAPRWLAGGGGAA